MLHRGDVRGRLLPSAAIPSAPSRRGPAARGLMLAMAGSMAACGGETRREAAIPLADCRLPKLATAALCGTLAVPENRAQPGARRVDLFVAVARCEHARRSRIRC